MTAPSSTSPVERMTNARHHGCAFDGWQCFHCGEIFETVGSAREHFGFDQSSEPACRIKLGGERGLLGALREAEKAAAAAWTRVHEESGDIMQGWHAAERRHREALEEMEIIGYERGLRDGSANLAPDELLEFWKTQVTNLQRALAGVLNNCPSSGWADPQVPDRASAVLAEVVDAKPPAQPGTARIPRDVLESLRERNTAATLPSRAPMSVPHRRIFTYKDQPQNVDAWRIGEACSNAAKESAGDFIDRGLGLLKFLQAKGMGVVEVDSTAESEDASA